MVIKSHRDFPFAVLNEHKKVIGIFWLIILNYDNEDL